MKVREVLWPLTTVAVVLLASFSVLILVEQARSAEGAILFVGKTSTYSSIGDALSAAKAGDTIVIGPGQYNESISIDKDKVTILGNGSAQTTIRGQAGLPTMEIRSDDVTISGLRIEDGAIISSSRNLTLVNLTIDCSTDPAVDLTNTENCTITDTTFLSTLGKAISSTGTKYTRLNRVSSVAGTLLYSTNSLSTYVTDCVFGSEDTGLVILSSKRVQVELRSSMTIKGSPAASFQTVSDIIFGGGTLVQDADGQCPIIFSACDNVSVIDLDLSYLRTMVEGLTFTGCSRIKVEDLSFAAGSSIWAIGLTDTDGVLVENSTFISNQEASTHIKVSGIVTDMSVKNCSFTLKGSGSTAVNIGQNSKVEVIKSSFFIESEWSIGITLGGKGCMLRGNTYYVSDDLSIGANITGWKNHLKGEVMFVSGTSSVGIFSENAVYLDINGARIRVTGTSAVGMDLKTPVTCLINATIVNVTEDGGPCLSANNSDLVVSNSTFNTRSDSPSVLLNNGRGTISDTWFHGSARGLNILNCNGVNIHRSTMNGLVPCSVSGSDNVRISNSDLFDLFLPVDGVRAGVGSNVFLHDSHFEGLYCDGTSEITVSNSIIIRTLTKELVPLPGVDIEAISDGSTIYQTGHFTQWAEPRTDDDGLIRPLSMTYAKYIRSDHPMHPVNTVEVFKEGTAPEKWSMTYPVNASEIRTIDLISPDIDLPQVPKNLTVTHLVTREALFLNWELNQDDTTEYWVHKLDEGTGNMVLVEKVDGNTASYTTDDLGERVNATFELRAWDGTYLSAPSNRAFAITVDLTPPPTPTGLIAGTITDSTVQFSWEHPGSDDLSHFEVQMNKTSTSALFQVVGTASPVERTITIPGLTWNTWYYFRVRAYDLSGNGSPSSTSLPVLTEYPPLEVIVQVNFADEGPYAGEPANDSAVRMYLSSGTLYGTFSTDGLGRCSIIGLVPDQDYYIEALPPVGTEGVERTRPGYLRATSMVFSMAAGSPTEELELVLPYQRPIVIGLIKVRVEFGQGPRTGPVHLSRISLIDGNGAVLRTVLGSGEGTASFSISDLPFSGKVSARPPEDLEGNPSMNVAGYLEAISGQLNITSEAPTPDTVLLSLTYYEGFVPPRYLYISRKMPTGSSVNLDAPLSITFDQPVNRTSIEAALSVDPPLSTPLITWSKDGTTIVIDHAGLLPITSYQVSVGTKAVSLNGTSFPVGYTENTWTFRTTGEPGKDHPDGPDLLMVLLIAIAVTALLVGAVIWIMSIRNKEEADYQDDELMEEALKEPDGLTIQEYPSDLVDGMVTGMPRGSETLEE
jgi:hypothetical protein